jgi:hypothetical protein
VLSRNEIQFPTLIQRVFLIAEVAEKAREIAEMLSTGRIVAVPAAAGTFEKKCKNKS